MAEIGAGTYAVLSDDEVRCVHTNVLRILETVGMEIQNHGLLRPLADAGLPVDFAGNRVRFPRDYVEGFIRAAEPYDWDHHRPWVRASAGIYHSQYQHPESAVLEPWTEETVAFYIGLARSLPHIGSATLLGSRIPVEPELDALYERYYCWKHGAREGGSINVNETCPYLYELYQVRADMLGVPVQEVFRATVYLVPALRLGKNEAYQVAYFRDRGLRVSIGDMFAMGATSPVTLAGSVTLNLAEQIALRILDHVWFGMKSFHIGGSISVMDLKTMIYPYGRPEMAMANLMTAQMARFYSARFFGHAALSDAKVPSAESGFQKALTALPTLMACGGLSIDAGLLSIDEICSPVQLVLDAEFASALSHLARSYDVTEESIGFDTIAAAGPGGQYLDSDHTIAYMRDEHWEPSIWSREMTSTWVESGHRTDADRAKEVVRKFRKDWNGESELPGDHERAITEVIRAARGRLSG